MRQNYPLIYEVGKGSAREPRLIDMRWGKRGAPQVTLIGKGVCFDTGGLDIKPSSGMILMKKDMGGAALRWRWRGCSWTPTPRCSCAC